MTVPLRKPGRAPVPPPPGRGRGRSLRALLALFAAAVVFFMAPAERAAAQTGSATPVDIPDPNLRARLETLLGKASGATITRAEMAGISGRVSFARSYAQRNDPNGAIRDLTGLEYATGLREVFFSYHWISDLTPLSGLTSLTLLSAITNRISDLSPLVGLTSLSVLSLDGNQVSDLSPLSGLTSLRNLFLERNRISDLTPLSGLTSLTNLSLWENLISNITPLSGLDSLTDLTLNNNRISDITPLRNKPSLRLLNLSHNENLRDLSTVTGMTALARLQLDGTSVTDLSPLVANAGLASGDQIYLRDVPHLNADAAGHVATLRGRGVTVFANDPLGLDRVVRGLRVTPGVERLTVSWNPLTAQTGFNPTGYRVQWRSGSQRYLTSATPPRHEDVIGTGTTSYTIFSLTPGVEYLVRVRSYGAYGPPSAPVSGIPQSRPPPPRPDRVDGVTVTPGVESLVVSWNQADNAGGYKVQWKSGEQEYDSAARQALTDDGGATSYTIPDLVPGVEYTVRVIATRAGSVNGMPSAEATGTPLAPAPGRVDGVTVTPGVESLAVSWSPVADANGYKVQWRSGEQDYDPAARQARTDDGGATSRTIPDLVPGVEYTVRVIATRAGSVNGMPSAEATGTPLAPAPGRVDGVTVTPGVESLAVSWSPVADANGYKVQWRSGEQDYDPAARQARTGDGGTTSRTIPDLVPGVEYTVRVIATKADAPDGEPSAEATGIPLTTPPGRVDGVTVSPGVESLAVSWNPVADAGGYKVQWKSGEQEYDPMARQARTEGMGTTSHTIPDLVSGVEYTVRVIATRAGAADGEPSAEATGVPGRRVGVSVADAAAMEGAAVEFPVRLTGPSIAAVTLTWITEAGGTARAGEDYRAVATGSLTLQPGDTAGTLRVQTLDDGQVEPAETFRVRLMEATNAAMDARAGSATGTIADDDMETARGRALGMVLAGTGRAIAADAVDVVGERFTRQPAEAQVAVGGLALTRTAFATREPVSSVASGMRIAPGGPIPGAAAPWGGAGQDGIGGAWATTEADEWTSWAPGEGFQRASALEWLSRSSFDLPLSRQDADEAAGGVGWRLWGRGTAGGFDGTPDAGFRMDGEVLSGYLGLDYRADRDTVLGMAVVHTRVDAGYETDAVTAGAVDLDMTSVLPYAHWKLRPDLGVWGLLGVGRGEVELEDEAGWVETGVGMLTAAFGLRQEVATWRGIDVAVKADTFLAELETEATEGLPTTAGDARRLRLRLEGRKEWELSAVSRMESSLDVGGRWDGGDAEAGLGVEVGGGLTYAHTKLGLEVDARGRYLVAHRKTAFDEWGGSVTVKLDPGQARQGPWLTFAPGWGAQGSRAAQMWDGAEVLRPNRSIGGTPGLSPDRLDLDVGYGLAQGAAELLTPYAGLSIAGPQARGYKMGARLEVDERLDLGVEGRHSVRADGDAGNEVMFYGHLRW